MHDVPRITPVWASHVCRVLKERKAQGYDVGQMPMNETELIQSVLQSKEAKFNSSDLNVAYRMKVSRHLRPAHIPESKITSLQRVGHA